MKVNIYFDTLPKTEDCLKLCHIIACNYAQECETRYGSDFYTERPDIAGDLEYYDHLLTESFDQMEILGGKRLYYQPNHSTNKVPAGMILDGHYYLPIGHPLNDKKYFQNHIRPNFDRLPEEYTPESWEEAGETIAYVLDRMEDFLGIEHADRDKDEVGERE